MDEITKLLPDFLLHSPTYHVAVSNESGDCIFASETFQKRFPAPASSLAAGLRAAIHPDDFGRCVRVLAHCLANPDAVEILPLRKPGGQPGGHGWAHWEFSALRMAAGNPAGVLCMGHDLESHSPDTDPSLLAERVANAMEGMEDGLYILGRDWRFEKTNRAAERILGKSGPELLGMDIRQVLSASITPHFLQQLGQVMDGYATVCFEEYHPDAQSWFSITAYPCLEGLTVFLKDTTPAHHTQEQLRHSENKLRAILDSTTDSNVLISPDFSILSFNETARANMLRFFGRQAYEGEDFRNYLFKDTEEIFYRAFAKAMQGERTELEWQLNPGNFKAWFRSGYYPVHDPHGNIIGVSLNVTDIDARKNAELELAGSEHILAAIYNSTTEANCFVSPDRKILYFNKVAYETMKARAGVPPKAGDDLQPYLKAEFRDEHEKYFERALRGNTIRLERNDGRDWYLFSLFPVHDSEGILVGVAETSSKITQSKQNELRVLSQNERLKNIMWQQCHEVRRPVANILGLAQLLATDAQTTGAYNATHLEYLIRTTEELDAIIHRIVAQTIETGLPPA